MAEPTSRRALPGDERSVAPRPRLVPGRRGVKASSWRHIPLATVMLTIILAVALAMAPTPRKPGGPFVSAPSARIAFESPAPTEALARFDPAPGAEPEPLPAWVAIENPMAPFNLDAAELDLPRRHDAARHTTGGGRDDVFVFGDFGVDAPHLRLSAYRPGGEAPPPSTFFVDLVRRAGEAGLAVVRSAVATPLATRLGAVEVAEVSLSGTSGARHCLAFRLNSAEPLRLSGWACGTAEQPAARARLACLIDRLDLVPGEEPGLASWFAAAGQGRSAACGGSHVLTTGSTRLVDEPAPAPKGSPRR